MTCTGLDLTIDGLLADPVIGAVMRADRVDPRRLESLLRDTARSLAGTRKASVAPLAVLADRARAAAAGICTRW